MSQTHEHFSAGLARRHRVGAAFRWLCLISTWATIGFLGVLLIAVGYKAYGWLDFQFLTSFDSRLAEKAGIVAALWGSIWVIGITAALSVPIGVGAAVYLEEYAKPNLLTRTIQLNISNLAGVPSIVYGILGYSVFAHTAGMVEHEYLLGLGFADIKFRFPLGASVIAGGLTLTLLSLPVVIISAQEALRSVPASLRHASYALGATKWQTIQSQVLPAALPGILTGVILALSRALGEAAPLAVLGAASYITFAPGHMTSVRDLGNHPHKLLEAPFDDFTAIPLQIYAWVSNASPSFQHVAAAGIVVMLTVLLLMNGTAIYIRQHFQRKIRW